MPSASVKSSLIKRKILLTEREDIGAAEKHREQHLGYLKGT
jgi:hypothetical protein